MLQRAPVGVERLAGLQDDGVHAVLGIGELHPVTRSERSPVGGRGVLLNGHGSLSRLPGGGTAGRAARLQQLGQVRDVQHADDILA
ncbi:hypothetical protein GCM10010166_36410 [Couchioplanes caeruleus subsp. azureus]|nr:hypothetical protein GCM10010166_36410 [Couchioplanes caeruleus subsp. azureus]